MNRAFSMSGSVRKPLTDLIKDMRNSKLQSSRRDNGVRRREELGEEESEHSLLLHVGRVAFLSSSSTTGNCL